MTLLDKEALTRENLDDRRQVEVAADKCLVPDAVARKDYDGLVTPGDVAMMLNITDEHTTHSWLVTRTMDETPTKRVVRILPVDEAPGRRTRVDERRAVVLRAGQGVTLRQLLGGSLHEGSSPLPELSEYSGDGDGLIWLDHRSSVAADTAADDPDVFVRVPNESNVPKSGPNRVVRPVARSELADLVDLLRREGGPIGADDGHTRFDLTPTALAARIEAARQTGPGNTRVSAAADQALQHAPTAKGHALPHGAETGQFDADTQRAVVAAAKNLVGSAEYALHHGVIDVHKPYIPVIQVEKAGWVRVGDSSLSVVAILSGPSEAREYGIFFHDSEYGEPRRMAVVPFVRQDNKRRPDFSRAVSLRPGEVLSLEDVTGQERGGAIRLGDDWQTVGINTGWQGLEILSRSSENER